MDEFGDIRSAARMRDLITRITRKVIQKERPEVRIGVVYWVDAGAGSAWVRFAGDSEDALTKADCAVNMTPTRSAMLHGADKADAVRVAGKPGSYYITDFVRGTPSGVSPVLTGSVIEFPGTNTPPGYLPCAGAVYQVTDYPELGALLRSDFGGNGSTTFAVPNKTGSTIGQFIIKT